MRTARNLTLSVLIIITLFSACSINKIAMKGMADALTGSGSTDVFTGDSDPQLVGDAVPFAIKLYETLLSANPKHQGLILTTGSLFVMYANAFVQGPAELWPADRSLEKAKELARAKALYLRGANIIYSGLELKWPGFNGAFQAGTLETYLAKAKKEDVPYFYWATAGLLSAYSINIFDLELGIRREEMVALIRRAYELDPDFNNGAIDDFYVLLYASLPKDLGGNVELAQVHYQRALEKSGGLLAGPYVSYAQSICIPAQDYEGFKERLDAALAIDVDADPSNRLLNVLSQRKAQYLLDNAANFFVDLETDDFWDSFK